VSAQILARVKRAQCSKAVKDKIHAAMFVISKHGKLSSIVAKEMDTVIMETNLHCYERCLAVFSARSLKERA
jgi:hypothetical protein